MSEKPPIRKGKREDGKVCLGVVVGARGIKGDVKVKSFTRHPKDVASYGRVHTEDGQRLALRVTGEAKGSVLVRISDVKDRAGAEALKGQQLYVARGQLPEEVAEDEYYHADLIGLTALDETDVECGTVIAVYDFGAGDVLDIRRPAGHTVMLPFTLQAIPEIDLSTGRIVISSQALASAEAGSV